MTRIFFTISLALAALSAAVSAAPTTNTNAKRCDDGDCEVYIVPSDDACDYEDYDDAVTKRDLHVSPYCMTPWEYSVVLRMCDDDLDDLEDFYEDFYDDFYDDDDFEDWDDAFTKRQRRPFFNSYSHLPPRCFPYAYYDRFNAMVTRYDGIVNEKFKDALTKRGEYYVNNNHGDNHEGNHRGDINGQGHGYYGGMTREEYMNWFDEND
ncbi:hypothetical protein K492DRAFT_196111 [Lichtheimia hyalospora FSU 10163]|nr:hypothetical protein K492DRAFT_196111 [Lichtheimia hyalospora FSU 10163]